MLTSYMFYLYLFLKYIVEENIANNFWNLNICNKLC
jgi:hypothetical protein